MLTKIFAVMLVVLAAQLAVAEEQVAKLSRIRRGGQDSPETLELTNRQSIESSNGFSFAQKMIDDSIFVVYTKDDVDKQVEKQKVQFDEKTVELRKIIDQLRSNIKSLSDMNDALTNRLNGIDAKLKKLDESK